MHIRASLLFLVALTASAQTGLDLTAVVASKLGLPIASLTQSDFTLLDNNVPQSITSFRSLGSKEPVHVTLVFDAVNVSFLGIAYQRDELAKYLRANGGHLATPRSWSSSPTVGLNFPAKSRPMAMN